MLHLKWSFAFGILLIYGVYGEFYSSVDTMQNLALVEQELLNVTHLYLEVQQQQLHLYSKFLDQIKLEHKWARTRLNLVEYLGHPLHSFRLLKRLVQDWDEVISGPLLNNTPRKDFQNSLESLTKDLGYPDLSELQGTIKGLARLQKIYNLNASDMANGVINGYLYDSMLEWHDCYEIGVQLFELKDYQTSLEWLQMALIILKEEEDDNHYLTEIREYIALAHFELGNYKRAEILLNQIPKSELVHKYLKNSNPGKKLPEEEFTWFANYTRLCQGKRFLEKSNGNPLKCFLDGKRHSYFTLSPLRVEQVHLDPEINVYHGILNPEQINSIFKESDKEQMDRSGVVGEDGNERSVSEIRVSQQTWLNYTSPIMEYVGRMNKYITGFSMVGSEHMQVANYGVGGQYEPHPDYFGLELPGNLDGDRISTSMIYLSEVEQGGYTVFISLNVFLPPVLGSMVVWHNLHRSLDADARTWHAGCPVIVGSKRIGNIWLHAGPQMFLRPCNLTSDSYKSESYHL